jgi:hypothetical protein
MAARQNPYNQHLVNLDTAVAFCRHAGLMDNHTEFLDIAAAFIAKLRERSAGRVGEGPQAPTQGWDWLLPQALKDVVLGTGGFP